MSELHEDMLDVAERIDAVAAEVQDLNRVQLVGPLRRTTQALETLKKIRMLRLEVDQRLREIELEAAQEAFRESARWGDIAQAIGVTRQTAQATYRDRENKPRTQQRRATPQPLNRQARRASWRDTNSWNAAMAGIEMEPDND